MSTQNTPVKKSTTKKKPPPLKTAVRQSEMNQISTKQRSIGGRNYIKKGGNGGARPGAGRKPASTTRKTREIADKLVEDGELTPLAYLLGVMRETPDDLKAQYESGEIDAVQYAVLFKELVKRRDNAAEKACAYIHPRLASIEAKVDSSQHESWLQLMEEAGM